MNRKYVASLFLAVSLVILHGVARASEGRHTAASPEATPVSVAIDNFSFGPKTVKVAAGTTVKWTNKDDIPHTVVSTDGIFKSHALDTDESFSHTFEKAGTYEYFCSLHPKMTGTVVVE